MSSSEESGATSPTTRDNGGNNKLRGIRRRKWGKWVSEIRVPGSQDRLWLGSYSAPEAAAVAHDIASYCLRGAPALHKLNFPLLLPAGVRADMSPRSVQLVASDAGMAVDAQLKANPHGGNSRGQEGNDRSFHQSRNGEDLTVSIDDYM